MQFFIALTFDESDLHYQKIDNFRKRFDYKHSRSPVVHMALMSPFHFEQKSLSQLDYYHLVECLKDDLDNFLSGFDDEFNVHFSGLDFAAGKKGVVYLKPEIPDELFFFREAATDFLKSSGATFNREEKGLKLSLESEHTFLPIGRGDDPELLSRAVEKARNEFGRPFFMKAKAVMLFEKKPGQWPYLSELHRFHSKEQYKKTSDDSFHAIPAYALKY